MLKVPADLWPRALIADRALVTIEMLLLELGDCLERTPGPAKNKQYAWMWLDVVGKRSLFLSIWTYEITDLSDFPSRPAVFAHHFAIDTFGHRNTLHVRTVGLGHELLATSNFSDQSRQCPEIRNEFKKYYSYTEKTCHFCPFDATVCFSNVWLAGTWMA